MIRARVMSVLYKVIPQELKTGKAFEHKGQVSRCNVESSFDTVVALYSMICI